MPLLPGKENIGHNISVEEAGKPHDQAIAIALSEAGESKKKKNTERMEAFYLYVLSHLYNK